MVKHWRGSSTDCNVGNTSIKRPHSLLSIIIFVGTCSFVDGTKLYIIKIIVPEVTGKLELATDNLLI